MCSFFMLSQGMCGDVTITTIGAGKWKFTGMFTFMDNQFVFSKKGFVTTSFITYKVQLFCVNVSFMSTPASSCTVSENIQMYFLKFCIKYTSDKKKRMGIPFEKDTYLF